MKRIYLGGSVVLGFPEENEKPSVENCECTVSCCMNMQNIGRLSVSTYFRKTTFPNLDHFQSYILWNGLVVF